MLFCRHGARAPINNMFKGGSDVTPTEEFALWESLLPSNAECNRLHELYPISVPDGTPEPPDVQSAPLGCLTAQGLEQMKAVGQHLKSTYAQRGIQEARLHIHSTNYQRTQLSAQGLLDGLTSGNGGGVNVHVIPTDRDFLNGFESRADEMLELVSKVVGSEAFQQVEWGKGKLIADTLRQLFPPGSILSRKTSPFRWMAAADFFLTRETAGLLESLSPELREVAPQTIAYSTWRFFQFYSDPKLLGIMAGPVLSNVVSVFQKMAAMTADCGDNNGYCRNHHDSNNHNDIIRDVRVYCCHDVTLLALHRCLGSTRAENEGFWPDFGSYLLFDMGFQRNLNGNKATAVNKNRETLFPMVRVACDGEPVSSSLIKTMKNGLVPLKDFIYHVNNIIKAGEGKLQIDHLQSRAAAGTRLSDELKEPISAQLHEIN